MNDTTRKIQALLFIAGEPVAIKELSELLDQPLAMIKEALNQLALELADQGLSIVVTATHAQLTTSALVSEYLQQYFDSENKKLSSAAAETLAIIAYQGPITRNDIEAIRGVDCGRMVQQLLSRGLIRRITSKERAATYVIAEEFLRHLGLTSVEQLPHWTQLSSHEKIKELLNLT